MEKCKDPMSVECSDKAERIYEKAMFKCLDCRGKVDARFTKDVQKCEEGDVDCEAKHIAKQQKGHTKCCMVDKRPALKEVYPECMALMEDEKVCKAAKKDAFREAKNECANPAE